MFSRSKSFYYLVVICSAFNTPTFRNTWCVWSSIVSPTNSPLTGSNAIWPEEAQHAVYNFCLDIWLVAWCLRCFHRIDWFFLKVHFCYVISNCSTPFSLQLTNKSFLETRLLLLLNWKSIYRLVGMLKNPTQQMSNRTSNCFSKQISSPQSNNNDHLS